MKSANFSKMFQDNLANMRLKNIFGEIREEDCESGGSSEEGDSSIS
jgi:hypothetical protein